MTNIFVWILSTQQGVRSEKFSTQLTDSQIKVIRFEFHFDGVISRIECTHKGCAGFPDNKKKHGTID